MINIIVKAKHFRALMEVAPTNDVRSYLNGIHINVETGNLEATDGHRALTVPFVFQTVAHLHENLILECPKTPPKKSDKSVKISIDQENHSYVVEYEGKSIGSQPVTRIDGPFPYLQHIIPSNIVLKGKARSIAFNVEYINKVASILANQKHKGVKFIFQEQELKPFLVDFDDPEVTYIVMPMRVNQ